MYLRQLHWLKEEFLSIGDDRLMARSSDDRSPEAPVSSVVNRIPLRPSRLKAFALLRRRLRVQHLEEVTRARDPTRVKPSQPSIKIGILPFTLPNGTADRRAFVIPHGRDLFLFL